MIPPRGSCDAISPVDAALERPGVRTIAAFARSRLRFMATCPACL
jgi:hypothetical protein